jgi:Spy/CpxP family protein refolding chaperone
MNPKLLVFTALLAAIPLSGQSATAKKPAGPPMGKEELRRCVAIDGQLSTLTKQYNVEVKLHNAVVATRQQMRTVLDEMQVALDAGDKSRIAEYNTKVDEYNLEAAKLEPHQNRMTQIAVEQNQASAEYNAKCANRTFRHEDMAEIKGIKKK